MATLRGDSLVLTDTLQDFSNLDNLHETASTVIGGVTYVYAASRGSDLIQISTLDADGTLTPVGTLADTAGTTLEDVTALRVVEVGGNTFLVAGNAPSGSTTDGLTVFSVSDTPPYLTFADRVLNNSDPDTNLDGIFGIETVTTSGGTYIYAGGLSGDGLSVFELSAAGGLTSVQNIAEDATLELNGVFGIEAFTRFGTTYLAVGAETDDGLSIFSVNPDGTLTSVTDFDGAADGSLDGTTGLTTFAIGNDVYVFAPQFAGDAVTVLRFDGSALEVVQIIESATALNGLIEARVIEIGDRALLAVASRNGSAVQVFEIETDPLTGALGTLFPVQSIEANTGQGALSGANYLQTVEIDGRTFVLAAARNSDAINVYEVGGGDDVLEGTVGADDIAGGGGDDLVLANAGDDTVLGGDGDDELRGGSGDDTVEGGAGSDVVEGGSGEDLLRGDDGSDWIRGGSGDDAASGGDGNDTIRGGDDEDRLFGSDGADVLAGNAGDDLLRGGNDADELFGGAGEDDMNGEDGDDALSGGLGDDLIRGGDGDDAVQGGRGADTLVGNSGDDTLSGGGGDDRLIAGTGTDVLTGGSGADTFIWSNVNQSAQSGARDRITDFRANEDTIDLSGFAGTLTFVGATYTGSANEVRYNESIGRLYIDLDGDRASDFSIDLDGDPPIDANDLIL
ncbi:calcium-binding protein [Jannaschia marina]|uniref:calcium-binding protein n=1 Tax=Jannaschia marina TaxID=2741674 RepID=UPI0015C9F044|nr:calcium-binding protein [Jannaschia marina]